MERRAFKSVLGWATALAVLAVWAARAGGAGGGAPAAAPAPGTASAPASQPTTQASPEVMAILNDLQAAGEKYATLKADLDYSHVDEALGDREERTGWVAYERASADPKTPAKFRIQFQTLQQGRGKPLKDVIDYAFDGLWLTEAKHRIKTMTRYQVAAKGENIEPTRLGQGPLPLPFGQKTADMLRHFQITTRPLKKDEPAGTVYLLLVTRPEFKKGMNFTILQMWIDRAKGLPVRIVTTDKNDMSTTVVLKNTQTDPKLPEDTFELPKPLGWTLNVKHLEAGTTLTP